MRAASVHHHRERVWTTATGNFIFWHFTSFFLGRARFIIFLDLPSDLHVLNENRQAVGVTVYSSPSESPKRRFWYKLTGGGEKRAGIAVVGVMRRSSV